MHKKKLEKERETLIQYIRVKLEKRDFHAIRDACVDIECINAQLDLLPS